MPELSIKDCLRTGWELYKTRPSIFIGSSLILFLLGMIAEGPRMGFEHLGNVRGGGGYVAAAFVASLGSIAFSFLLSIGKTAFYLRAHDSVRDVRLMDLWHPRGYLRFVGAAILSGLAIVLGLLLLIVPGIIIGILLSFALYLVVDRDLGPIASLKESARLTKGNRWKLLWLGLALLGINILGFCALIVGLLATLPVSGLAVVHAYRVLSAAASSEASPQT